MCLEESRGMESGEAGSGVLVEQRCHLTGLQKVTIQCAQILKDPAQLNCGLESHSRPEFSQEDTLRRWGSEEI